jgi:hypothetical protein
MSGSTKNGIAVDGVGQLGIASSPFIDPNPELITNGTFDTDSGWTKDAGWTITGGKGVATAAAFGASISQAIPELQTELSYDVSIEVSDLTQGEIMLLVGDSGGSAPITTNGTHTRQITCLGALNFFIYANATLTCKVDNVSCKLA